MNNGTRNVACAIFIGIAAQVGDACANTAPTAGDVGPIDALSEHSCEYQKTYTWQPLVFDADGDPLTCHLTTAPGRATVASDCSGGTYRPPCYIDAISGTVSFSYIATDGALSSNLGTVTFNVKANLCSLPSPITLPAISYTATPGATINWSVYTEGNTNYCVVSASPGNGVATRDLARPCEGTYTPNIGFLGQDKFSYSLSWFYEGYICVQKQIGEIAVTVAESNPIPTAANVTASGPYAIAENASYIRWYPIVSDPRGDALRCRVVTPPKNGRAFFFSDGISCQGAYYVPVPDLIGMDTFSYVANDGQNDSNLATVTVNVIDLNSAPPTVEDINLSVTSGATAGWTPKASSASGHLLNCRIDTAPVNGTSTIAGDCSAGDYRSNSGFVGTDSFTYIASDGLRDSASGTVTVAVTEPLPTDPCLAQYPVTQFTQTGKAGTLSITFTGNITSHTNKEVKVCPGTTLKYNAISTQGAVICRAKNNTTRHSGTLRISDHLKCTDKPAGKDKIVFKVKSGMT